MSHKILPEYEKLLQIARGNKKENSVFFQKLKKTNLKISMWLQMNFTKRHFKILFQNNISSPIDEL